jgi:hypothetical protein
MASTAMLQSLLQLKLCFTPEIVIINLIEKEEKKGSIVQYPGVDRKSPAFSAACLMN